VLLQKDGEVAKAYQVNGTPAGYLVSAEGKIASEPAIGAEALLTLATGGLESRLQPAGTASSDTEHAAQAEAQATWGPAKAGTPNDGRGNRFSQRSVARSKIKRDGLKAGTPAPEFRLPRLDGHGELALEELRGRRVLLVFSDPHCGPCNALAPELEKFHRKQNSDSPPPSPPGEGEQSPMLEVVMISRGEPKENRAKVKLHGLTFPVVLQQQWEISRRYAMFATPMAYLIDESGVITQDVAVGTDAIQGLMARARRLRDEIPEAV
jgi:peroxiredoxin